MCKEKKGGGREGGKQGRKDGRREGGRKILHMRHVSFSVLRQQYGHPGQGELHAN